MKTIKVTFRVNTKFKENRKWVNKVIEFNEEHKNESEAKLRALALNWQIIKIENL